MRKSRGDLVRGFFLALSRLAARVRVAMATSDLGARA
jgi:hypothetical protein